MAVLFVFLFILTAILLILLLRIEVDFKYERGAVIVLNFGVLALEISDINSSRSKKRKNALSKTDGSTHPTKKSRSFLKAFIYILRKSKLHIATVSFPRFYFFSDDPTEYRLTPAISALISFLIAYLSTNSEKLYQKPDAYSFSFDNTLRIDIGASFLLFHALLSIPRLLSGGKKEGKDYVRN